MSEIFYVLDTIMPAHGGEIQLTDALRVLTRKRGMYEPFEGCLLARPQQSDHALNLLVARDGISIMRLILQIRTCFRSLY